MQFFTPNQHNFIKEISDTALEFKKKDMIREMCEDSHIAPYMIINKYVNKIRDAFNLEGFHIPLIKMSITKSIDIHIMYLLKELHSHNVSIEDIISK